LFLYREGQADDSNSGRRPREDSRRWAHPMIRETMYCALLSIRGDASYLPSSVAT
jgi:hypothetical protein